ncbi:hypothetical protein V1504DRAFT_319887 [Lipomyces starkeyi]
MRACTMTNTRHRSYTRTSHALCWLTCLLTTATATANGNGDGHGEQASLSYDCALASPVAVGGVYRIWAVLDRVHGLHSFAVGEPHFKGWRRCDTVTGTGLVPGERGGR